MCLYTQGPGSSLEEVWFEHQTVDGKSYFSHPRTLKTVWEKPQGARIVQAPPQPMLGVSLHHYKCAVL